MSDSPNHVTTVPETDGTDFIKWAVFKDVKGGRVIDPERSKNYYAFAAHHHAFKGVFAWDEFQLKPLMVKCPEWYPDADARTFKVHEVNAEDITLCDYALQSYGMNGSFEKTKQAIGVAARENKVHPARDYFNSLKWDGVPRLSTWLQRYCSARGDDPEYLAAVGTKWLVAAVARVMDPGCKFDCMLIFEGNQGAGKSRTLKELATFGDEGNEQTYFTDDFSLPNADNKDELGKLCGVLICEIAEMDGFYKRENTFLKALISRQTDKYRPPYGISVREFPRQFVFAGSYNPTGGIISDPTGARRFWFVKNSGNFDVNALKKDKSQLWAEAVQLYRKKEPLYLDEKLALIAADEAAKRRIIDDWERDVMSISDPCEFIEVVDIMKQMNLDHTRRSSNEKRRIESILRANGWEYGRRYKRGKQVYGWSNPAHPFSEKKPQGEFEIPLEEPHPDGDY